MDAAEQRRQSKRVRLMTLVVLALAGGANVLFILLLSLTNTARPPGTLGEPPKARPAVRIFAFQGEADWQRADALQFAMSETTAMINFTFTGAGVMLAFAVKLLGDSRARGLSRVWLLAAGLGCVSSLVGGMAARGYLPRLITLDQFDLQGEFGLSMFFQQSTIVLGAVCLLFAALPILWRPNLDGG